MYNGLRRDGDGASGRVEFQDVVAVDNKQQQMLDFEKNWYPFGGGSSRAITERFGLNDRDFFRQIDQIVQEEPPTSLTSAELRRMRGVIRRRLWMAR